ncbi:membrane protein [Paenibacillus beijingensis]|uniref:Membrane protein n=2 Tax=Paenibacillus beijingensis TaxID=1126833 RepID=A0A0D5NQX7_9BACL|nr:membrane protein [Paenibacillus beijingensis]
MINHPQPVKGAPRAGWRDANRHRKPLLLAGSMLLLIFVLAAGGFYYRITNTVDYTAVYINGQSVGTVAAQSDVEQLVQAKTKEAQAKYPNLEMEIDSSGLSYVKESGYKAQPQTEATLDKLDALLVPYAKGVEVKVNGNVIGIVKNEATAKAVLQQVKNKYAPPSRLKKPVQVKALSYSAATEAPSSGSRISQVKFVEDVQTEAVKTDPSNMMGQNQLYTKIITGSTQKTSYTVQKGDCVGCIAAKFDISPEVIYKNNPSVQDDLIKAGEVLDLTAQAPAVTVQTLESQVETIQTEPQVIIQKRDTMKAGETKVIQQGQPGIKRLTYKLVKQNGLMMSEELVGMEVIKKSVPKIVLSGTKVVVGEGSGDFIWPVSGHRITSGFGARWGRLHKGIDLVGGSSIKAADEGVVEFAGQKSGYGNVIIINHKNGYKTLYAHLSKISVSDGEVVEKGDSIGVMGNTGHSFGTHLHFEIHRNGNEQNPLKYY